MGGKVPGRVAEDIKKRISKTAKILLFLDYDGTLTPIRKKPGLAKLGKKTRTLLKRLSRLRSIDLFIISGRALRDVKNLVKIKSITYSGNHGIELDGPHYSYINPTAKAMRGEVQHCYRLIRKKLKVKGVILENKIYTLSVHYRVVAATDIKKLMRIFDSAISHLRGNKMIRITEGKKVLEVRPNAKWDKGKVIRLILGKKSSKKALPIYIGDDITDEDAFRALGKKGISILVSSEGRRTSARYTVRSPEEVFNILDLILTEHA